MTLRRFAATGFLALLVACSGDNGDIATSDRGADEERALSEAAEMLDERRSEGGDTPSPASGDGE